MHQVRPLAGVAHRGHHALRAQKVRLRRQVGRVVELHRRGGVDDDVASRQLDAACVS